MTWWLLRNPIVLIIVFDVWMEKLDASEDCEVKGVVDVGLVLSLVVVKMPKT